MKYFVTYCVQGFPGEQRRGPYSEREVESHRRDIEGYEGIYDCKVVPEPSGDEKGDEEQHGEKDDLQKS